MNRLEVWNICDAENIEETVNKFCSHYEVEPISVSVAWNSVEHKWCVCVVVKECDSND